MSAIYSCYSCGQAIDDPKVGRGESCPKCRRDVRVCKNCTFYDLSAYNYCREPQAERVVDKEKGNFCDYFKFRQQNMQQNKQQNNSPDLTGKPSVGTKSLEKLEDLFKK